MTADDTGAKCQKFNIVGSTEINNLELAQFIADTQGKPLNYEMIDFHSSRPGHDLRYSVDDSKLRALGYAPQMKFDDALAATVEWYRSNEDWWRRVMDGSYREWVVTQYES